MFCRFDDLESDLTGFDSRNRVAEQPVFSTPDNTLKALEIITKKQLIFKELCDRMSVLHAMFW